MKENEEKQIMKKEPEGALAVKLGLGNFGKLFKPDSKSLEKVKLEGRYYAKEEYDKHRMDEFDDRLGKVELKVSDLINTLNKESEKYLQKHSELVDKVESLQKNKTSTEEKIQRLREDLKLILSEREELEQKIKNLAENKDDEKVKRNIKKLNVQYNSIKLDQKN